MSCTTTPTLLPSNVDEFPYRISERQFETTISLPKPSLPTTQHNTTQHNTTQHNTTQHNVNVNVNVNTFTNSVAMITSSSLLQANKQSPMWFLTMTPIPIRS
jgi:hypothetical protein